MTESNKKVIETLQVLGITKVEKLEDGLLEQEWYKLSNTVKYIKLLEKKFNIAFSMNEYYDLLKYEISSTNPLFWQTVYKMTEIDTYRNLGISDNQHILEGLNKAFSQYKPKYLNKVISGVYDAIYSFKLVLLSHFFLSNSDLIKAVFVHNDKIYVAREDVEKIGKDIERYKSLSTYSISEIAYTIWRGKMFGKDLRPIMTHDEPKELAKNERYLYLLHYNYQHEELVNFNNHAYLLKDCEFILMA